LGLTGPITLVLDNARNQYNAAVKALAMQLGITLLFLPSYSPELYLIERLQKFIERRALYGRYHPTFADFRGAIEEILDSLSTTHADGLKPLMKLNLQQFENVALMAAGGIIERLSKFAKRHAHNDRYHPTFAGFGAPIDKTFHGLSATQAGLLRTLMASVLSNSTMCRSWRRGV
jgi:hypothetical protein